MAQKHPYFTEHHFDKSYKVITRSFKLKPNEKAIINHIITWQETMDEKSGKLLGLVCFESNSTLSRELGIPLSTLESLITNMKKKYDFFTSTSIPGKGHSKRGGNFNRTIKRIDMAKLKVFLEAEQTLLEVDHNHIEDENIYQLKIIGEIKENTPFTPQTDLKQQGASEESNSNELKPDGDDGLVICQIQDPNAPESFPILKNRTSKKVAFDQLTELIFYLEGGFHNEVKQVKIDLQVALMTHPSLSQEKKIFYNEWISEFMAEEYSIIKEWFINYQEERNRIKPAVPSIDHRHLP